MINFLLSFDKNKEISQAYDKLAYDLGSAIGYLKKEASIKTNALSGELYASSNGAVLLSVPNAIVRGTFDALDENGLSLPGKNGKFNAHIVVMTPDEVDKLGGLSKITERGHHFHYNLGPLHEAPASEMFDFSKVWFLSVISSDLAQLRKTYGLTPSPGRNGFNLVVALRKLGVLGKNDIKKHAAAANLYGKVKNKTKNKTDLLHDLFTYYQRTKELNSKLDNSIEHQNPFIDLSADSPLGSNVPSMLGGN